jgi:hypothetical protein
MFYDAKSFFGNNFNFYIVDDYSDTYDIRSRVKEIKSMLKSKNIKQYEKISLSRELAKLLAEIRNKK